MADVAEVPAGRTKARLVDNFYIDSKNERASRPQVDVVAVGKKFLESGYTEILKLQDLKHEQLLQAAAFGLQQVGQNAYGAAKDENERIEALQARWETILSGKWAGEGRESGVRTGDLIEAWKLAKKDVTGRDPEEAEVDRLKAALESGEITREGLAENKAVAAKLAAIRAQRAADRAAKAAQDAQGVEEELPSF